MTAIALWLGSTLAWALTAGEPLKLELAGEVVLEGTFRSTDGEVLVLTTQGESLRVSLALVEGCERAGSTLDPEVLRQEALLWAESQVPTGPTPHPAVVGIASAVLPGSGHLFLRDVPTWAGYAAVDATLLALAGWFGFREQAPDAVGVFLALDLLFRGYAVREAVLDARRLRPAREGPVARAGARCTGAVSMVPLPSGGMVAVVGASCGRVMGTQDSP